MVSAIFIDFQLFYILSRIIPVEGRLHYAISDIIFYFPCKYSLKNTALDIEVSINQDSVNRHTYL